MKILLIANGYPPFPASGSRRAWHLARAMHGAGHQVHVLTARLPDEEARYRVREDGVEVETIASLPTLLDLYGSIRENLGGLPSVPVSSVADPVPDRPDLDGARAPDSPRSSLKRILLSFLTWPDGARGFVVPTVLRGLALAARDVDLLYTTAPPRLSHLVGLGLRRFTGVPWVAEFRDPWVVDGVPVRSPRLRSGVTDAIERRLEAACVETADAVVTVTRSHLAHLRKRNQTGTPRTAAVVRNGIPEGRSESDSDCRSSRRGAPEPRRILHLGSLYWGRDAAPFLQALAALRKREELPECGVAVEFVGNGADCYGPLVTRMGLDDLVRFRSWMPYEKGQELLANADLCLLFAQEQPLQVPNKLYEYLGVRRPILAFADADGETAQMLRRVGDHYLVTADEPSSRTMEIVGAALRNEKTHRLRPEATNPGEVLASWTTARQMERLVALLSEVT